MRRRHLPDLEMVKPRYAVIILAFLSGFVATSMVSAEQRPPEPAVWVSYEPFFELWEQGSPDDNSETIMGRGHGRPPIFTMRLNASYPRRAFIRTPRELDGYELRAQPIELPHSRPANDFQVAENARAELVEAIRHHWPPIGISLEPVGARVIPTPRSDRYQRCAARRLRAAADRLLAAASNDREREDAVEYRQDANERPGSPITGAELLLQLMSLGLPPVENGRLTQNARRRMREQQTSDGPSQHTVRDPLILAHGQEYEQQVDLIADRLSARARICRMVPLSRIQDPASDRCRIASVVDRRDGWPLFISILREKIAANGAREGRVDFYSRLVPLEGFVPPPNPCPDA